MDAKITWHPLGDNRAPILRYTIQYNTTFTPDVWEDAYDNVPATDMTYTVRTSVLVDPMLSKPSQANVIRFKKIRLLCVNSFI